MGVVPLLGALPFLGSPKWSGLSVLLFIVAGGLFLLAFLSKRDSSPEHRWRHFIYKAGFIREKAGRVEVYAWSDIAKVKDKIIEFRRYGSITSRYYRATLHLRNGGSVTFEEGLPPQGHSLPLTLIQEIVTRANACLVQAQRDVPLAQIWGGGYVASVDGIRFVVPIRSVNTGPSPHYFGLGRGVYVIWNRSLWYHLDSKQVDI